MKRRDNNRGFTLVELIIAVAILAIVISPLFANFIQSSKMNLAGRKNLNAMNLAQDMMEGMSGYKGDEIDQLVQAVVKDPTNAKPLNGTIFPATATCGAVQVLTGTDYAYADADPDTVPDKTKKYGYKFTDVVTVTGEEHNTYNVELLIDPTGTDQEKFNNKELADISEVNQYYDAIFTQESSEVDSAITWLRGKSSDQSIPEESYKGNINRITYITIKNSGTETAPNYSVGVKREYRVANPSNFGLTDDDVCIYNTENISRMESDKLPRSVYFYFEGMEGASYVDLMGSGDPNETIKVINTTGEDIKVYLIRTQKINPDGTPADATYQPAYSDLFGCKVEIESTSMTGAATENVEVVSNLRFDLCPTSEECNVRDVDENNQAIAGVTLPDGYSINGYKKYRADYYYNGALVTEDLYQKKFHDGYPSDEKNTIYKVVINIYEAGTGKKVATYDGGLSN